MRVMVWTELGCVLTSVPLDLVGGAERERHPSFPLHSLVYVTPPDVIATGPDFSHASPSSDTEYSIAEVPAPCGNSILRATPSAASSVIGGAGAGLRFILPSTDGAACPLRASCSVNATSSGVKRTGMMLDGPGPR